MDSSKSCGPIPTCKPGRVVEHPWGSGVIRFYDLDGHLIEVGESMKLVIRRFQAAGMTPEEIARKMDVLSKTWTSCSALPERNFSGPVALRFRSTASPAAHAWLPVFCTENFAK